MIKNIIFDFGDVFLNLDKAATLREMKSFGIPEFSQENLQHNMRYEKGEISSEVFIRDYCRNFPQLSEENFCNSWNAILLDFPRHRLEFLKNLSKEGKFFLVLLSNTNDLHIEWVKQNISFFQEFKSCFDGFYLSHEIGLRKPDREIYEFVLQQHNFNPSETLFIDDTAENTVAAAKLGLHTWNIDPEKEDVTALFEVKKHLF